MRPMNKGVEASLRAKTKDLFALKKVGGLNEVAMKAMPNDKTTKRSNFVSNELKLRNRLQ